MQSAFRYHHQMPGKVSSPLFHQLISEWITLNSTTSASNTVTRWATSEPLLEGFHHPHEIVDAIDSAQADQKDAYFLALLRLTQQGQALAGRILLQLMLPKLGRIALRMAARDADTLWGEDRRQRILLAAEHLLARNGWRNTSLAQIARNAGVSAAGLLHHFASKEQLLHAVLDARDADDDSHADRSGDLIEEIQRVAERFARAPELVGTFTVLLAENVLPEAPLHDRMLKRYRAAVEIVADLIRRGQDAGRYRSDFDADIKAAEILAFINGMEMSWLLDPSLPLNEVFTAYTETLARDFAPPAKDGHR